MMVLALCVSIAGAEATKDFLGKPFPGFTVTDSEGKTFTLSEALKDHEAVLINFWATWCDPCKNEFPMLNKVYEEVKDKVAFIALSKEPKDTAEKIEAFRQERGLAFPMGRDEDQKLLNGAGNLHARWEYAEETTELSADGQKAYVIHVVDQDGNPVEEVTVNFCTDTACTPEETDEAGMIAFEGEPREYHVQIVDVPEGYSYDESFDMYTTLAQNADRKKAL